MDGQKQEQANYECVMIKIPTYDIGNGFLKDFLAIDLCHNFW